MTIQESAVPAMLQGAALAESLKKRLGAAALAVALVPLAVAGTVSEADAGTPFPERRSHVEGTATPSGSQFLYQFEVFNTSDLLYGEIDGNNLIVNWELPLFSLNGIDVNSIQSPQFWTFEIIDTAGNIVIDGDGNTSGVSNIYNTDGPYGEYVWDWTAADDPVFQADNDVYGPDPDQFEDPNLILHWFTLDFEGPADPIFEDDSRTGFSFLADDGSTNAPYQASWLFDDPTIGDPPTPEGSSIGVVPNNATVSEPGMIALFATGLLGLLGLRRRRNSA